MPITLKPMTRRGFLAGSLAAGAGLLLRDRALAADPVKRDPNRFRGIYDSARAAEAADNPQLARVHYTKLQTLAATGDTERAEVAQAKAFLSSR